MISRHLSNIFNDEELTLDSVVAFFATTAQDAKIYQVEHFNLDAIISVGYRVNSKRGAQFRRWSSSVLRSHLTKGYSINKVQIDSKNFSKNAKVVPRDYFRIKPKDISFKSAVELRKNLKYIKPDDFVILLDHISDNRFIKSDPKKDLNIFVSKFSIDQTYNYNKDRLEMESIIKQINQFIGQGP